MKNLCLVFISILFTFSCSSDDDAPAPEERDFSYTQEEKDEEIARLKQYLQDNDYKDVQETASGLHYIIEQQGDGLTPSLDDTVVFHSEITNLETNKLLEISNREDNNYGQPKEMFWLLEGVREGFLLINEGSIIRMFIPSYLAFGKFGNFTDSIEPKTNMMYKMELNLVIRSVTQ